MKEIHVRFCPRACKVKSSSNCHAQTSVNVTSHGPSLELYPLARWIKLPSPVSKGYSERTGATTSRLPSYLSVSYQFVGTEKRSLLKQPRPHPQMKPPANKYQGNVNIFTHNVYLFSEEKILSFPLHFKLRMCKWFCIDTLSENPLDPVSHRDDCRERSLITVSTAASPGSLQGRGTWEDNVKPQRYICGLSKTRPACIASLSNIHEYPALQKLLGLKRRVRVTTVTLSCLEHAHDKLGTVLMLYINSSLIL